MGDTGAAVSRESAAKNTHNTVFALLREGTPTGRVLDIPCGSGAFTRRLLQADYQTVAADIVRHPALPPVEFHQADMNQALPFDDASFDAVVSIDGVEHIRRPHDFVGECGRVLAPGGRLYIVTANISAIRSRWRWLLTGFHNKNKYPLDEANPQPRHHINMIDFPKLRYMLHTSGLRIEHIATNRIKMVSWLYAPLAGVQYLASLTVLRRGIKNEAHGRQTREVLRHMMSVPILFGESMVIVAHRPGD